MCSSDIVRKTFIAWYTLNAGVVFVCEMIIDIVKHSFIAKFNDIKPFAYSEFLEGPMQAEWDWRFERWKCGTRT
ncbi:putative Tapt1 family protein [Rosa chinensis]|uniref:Putative Tapt1 family protein n=1 Tax=Rosa chinensis TaxID=74649 RepID=A0A2P6QQC0_ROSCH|nr:putative Tapt1 family protein [Rosa chinensis]